MTEDFQRDFQALGLRRGDAVLMHSSMKALGTERTPREFLEELIGYLGPEGTLLLPALSYQSVTPENPVFDARNTEPCVGLLPRTFLRMPGVARSLHPTHSVCALGRLAAELTAGQEADETPVGPNSPFRRLPAADGKILMLGVSGSLTFLHGVEEIAGAPYTLSAERTRYTLIRADGSRFERALYRHAFQGVAQKYGRAEALLSPPEVKTGYIGKAWCRLYDAAALKRVCLEALASDPYYFVELSPR